MIYFTIIQHAGCQGNLGHIGLLPEWTFRQLDTGNDLAVSCIAAAAGPRAKPFGKDGKPCSARPSAKKAACSPAGRVPTRLDADAWPARCLAQQAQALRTLMEVRLHGAPSAE